MFTMNVFKEKGLVLWKGLINNQDKSGYNNQKKFIENYLIDKIVEKNIFSITKKQFVLLCCLILIDELSKKTKNKYLLSITPKIYKLFDNSIAKSVIVENNNNFNSIDGKVLKILNIITTEKIIHTKFIVCVIISLDLAIKNFREGDSNIDYIISNISKFNMFDQNKTDNIAWNSHNALEHKLFSIWERKTKII